MPRPFAVIGITVFLVLSALYNSSGETAVLALLFFTLALIISLIIKPVRRQSVFPVALAGAAVACLMLVCVNEFYYYPQLSLADSTHTAKITVTSQAELNYGNYYFEGKATEIDGNKTSAKVRLVFSSSPEVSPYDSIEGNFTFYVLGASSDEAQSSYKAENRFLGAYTADEDYNILPNTSKIKPIGYYMIAFRSGVRTLLMRLLPNDYGALCTALVLGDRSNLSSKAYSDLRQCGVTHVICVSGLHISIWTAAALWLLRKLRLGEKTACALTIPIVLLLMFAAGMTWSVVRSGIMMIIYLLSILISRRRDSLNSLGIALLIISASNPFAMGAASLRLSALSTMGIILYSEYCNPLVTAWFKKHSRLSFAEKPFKLIMVTCAAVAFCLPVSISLYGNFNFCVFPANLFVVTAAEICMLCSAMAVAIGAVSLSIFNLPALAAGFMAKYIIAVTSLLAKVRVLNIRVSETDAYMLLCGLFVFCALVSLVAYTGKKVMPVSAAMFAVILTFSVISFAFNDYNKTFIRVFDTGDAVAVLVSDRGKNILIGCGGESYNSAYEIKQGIELAGGYLDAVIIPADKERYTSCLYSVTSQYKPDAIYCPDGMNLTGFDNVLSLDKSIKSKTITIDYYGTSDAVTLETKDIKLAVTGGFIDSDFSDNIKDSQVIISCSDYPDAQLDSLDLYVISTSASRGSLLLGELESQGINAAVTAGGGSILITADNGSTAIQRF